MQVAQVVFNAFALAFQKAGHRVGKAGVRQPVRAAGFDRQQGARHLVFALCAAFKTLVAVRNAPGQWLVVAGLKVQAVHAFQRAPVAAIGHFGLGRANGARRVAAQGNQAAGHGLALALGHKQQPVARHAALHAGKEVAAQIRRVAVFQVGALVAAVKKVPVCRTNIRALRPAKLHASVSHLAPLLADLFAFVLRQVRQKFVKVGIAGRAVVPMKLHGVAQH